MAEAVQEKKRVKNQKMVRMRYVWSVVLVIGLGMLLYLEPQMGKVHTTIGQVFGILIGGLMFFSGGIGTAVTTLFLRLENKDKDQAW